MACCMGCLLYTSGKTVIAEIFPDEIQIGEGEGAWTIPLDGTSWFQELEDLFVIRTPQNRLAVFPIRSIEPVSYTHLEGNVTVNGEPCLMRGKKLRSGEWFCFHGKEYEVSHS